MLHLVMSVIISDQLLEQANLSEQELRIEIALIFFQKKAFTLGKASEFAGIPQIRFQKILADRKIPLHYAYEDLLEDLESLKALDS